MFRCFLSGCIALLAMHFSLAQVPADKALATMTAGEGLQVELFASEPMLVNPTAIDVDEKGRVWVAEAVNYRRKNFNRPILREEGDRIVVLIDTNGDGKADESKVFYQGKDLYGPLSVLVIPQVKDSKPAGYRVLVAQSPDILEFTDADGDLKADGPPKKFLTGFGGFDHDHGVHGLHMGPDGKLYFTVGDSGVTGLQSADGKGKKYVTNTTDVQKGTVWRCDLQGNNLELIAHNFRNNYEACVDSFGEIWCSDNDDDGNQQTRICFVMPGGNYGYGPRGQGQSHWHEEQPGIVHKTLRTGFGSPCGIQFYEGNLLPAAYHNTLMHADCGPREIRAFTRKAKGAGYELTKANMLTSSDNWFRPVDVCTAPDGSVFVADWYDPGVGGHGMGDHTRGRIYRLTPKGHVGYKVPEVKYTKPECINNLSSCCNALRSAFQIQAISDVSLISPETFHAVERQGDLTSAARISLFLSTHAGPRAAESFFDGFIEKPGILQELAFRLVNGQYRELSKRFQENIVDTPAKFVDKGSITSLREYLLYMRTIESSDKLGASILKIAKRYDGQDQVFRAALNIACGTDPARRDAILADFEKHFPEWNDKVADLVWELRPKSMLPKMGELLTSDKITAAQKARIVDILASSDDLSAGKTVLSILSGKHPEAVKQQAIDNLKLFLPTKWKELIKTEEFKTIVSELLETKPTQRMGMQLVAAAKYLPAIAKVDAIAFNENPSDDFNTIAIQTLGSLTSPDSVKALERYLKIDRYSSIACAALASQITGQSEGSKLALGLLSDVVGNEKATLKLRTEALAALAGSRAGTTYLLSQQEAKKLPASLIPEAGRLLRNSPFQGERNKAMILFPAPGKLNPKNLPTAAVLATKKGDAANGQKLMAASLKGEAQCMKCHMVRGQGGQIGPDLSMIGKKGSRENLFESILVPSKAIADQYVSWKVDTADGISVTGLLVRETETSLTLRDANGKDYEIAVKDIDKRSKSLVSIMPEGLAATLTEDELIDLVEYMTTLQTASLTPDSWLIAGPFASATMEAALTTDHKPTDFKLIKLSTAYVDLATLHGNKANNSASYAKKEIESPVAQEATILLGIDDGGYVYLNGEKVFETKETKAAYPEQHTIKVKLKAGVNEVLVKVANGNNPHGFYFTLTSNEPLKAK
ncbi:MAG: PVC-type heme-binding CxxCH protein [Fimbriiglobus sp.]